MNFIKNLFAVVLVAMTIAFVGCGKDGACPDVKSCPSGQLLDTKTCTCVDKEEPAQPTEETVTANITKDTKWTSNKTYILDSRVTVESGATLTIEPGTVIKGAAGTGPSSTALLVARGGKLMAEGTASAPIIFTSVADKLTSAMVKGGKFESPNLANNVNGLWGGVIVLGKAPISAKNKTTGAQLQEVQIEGIPASDSNGLYGGSVADDNSGVIKYVSIRHGGTNIGDGNEINGLTLGGVGSGTTIMNVEVVANQDDGIELFGGTVNVSNILLWNCGDDSIDTDQAWNGTLENFIVVTPQGGSAMELDGPEGNYEQGTNTIKNGIVYAGDKIFNLVDWDSNTNSGVSNVYFFGMPKNYGPWVDSKGKNQTPIASFGGDGKAETINWEYTLSEGSTVESVFSGVTTEILSEVAAGAYTHGPAASDFAWTWASKSGSLSTIGVK